MKTITQFELMSNEGSFFDEDWLLVTFEGGDTRQFRYDRVPPRIKRAFAAHLRAKGRMTPNEASMIIHWVEFDRYYSKVVEDKWQKSQKSRRKRGGRS